MSNRRIGLFIALLATASMLGGWGPVRRPARKACAKQRAPRTTCRRRARRCVRRVVRRQPVVVRTAPVSQRRVPAVVSAPARKSSEASQKQKSAVVVPAAIVVKGGPAAAAKRAVEVKTADEPTDTPPAPELAQMVRRAINNPASSPCYVPARRRCRRAPVINFSLPRLLGFCCKPNPCCPPPSCCPPKPCGTNVVPSCGGSPAPIWEE